MAFDRSIIGKSLEPKQFEYDWRRTALYALGAGAGPSELDLLLETRGPKVLPSFSVVPVLANVSDAIARLGGNVLTLVHGGQRCVIHRPIPPEGTLTTTMTVSALYDKGKGALAIFESKTTANGQPVFDTEWQIFYRGEGGFGGERGPEPPAYTPPEGKTADFKVEMPTSPAQALLYRLGSGDLNPIHADPDIAKAVGFPKPILHGLCTFGHATRAAVQSLAGGDPDKVTSVEGRFSKPVFPGDTIVTEIWKMSDGEAYFTTSVKERSEPVITLGRVLYRA